MKAGAQLSPFDAVWDPNLWDAVIIQGGPFHLS